LSVVKTYRYLRIHPDGKQEHIKDIHAVNITQADDTFCDIHQLEIKDIRNTNFDKGPVIVVQPLGLSGPTHYEDTSE
jgi:hypothetical protein